MKIATSSGIIHGMIKMKNNCAALCILCVALYCTACSVDKKTTKKEIRLHESASIMQQEIQKQKLTNRTTIERYLGTLSEEEQIAQLFLVNLIGDKNYKPLEKRSDVGMTTKKDALVPGGYIFFSYNVAKTPEEIIAYTSEIKSWPNVNYKNSDLVLPPPYIAIDQEGGEVDRLRLITSALPSSKRIATVVTSDVAYQIYKRQAEQLKALGFDLNLAPVVEVVNEENEFFLQERSFGDRKKVIDYGSAAVQAYEKNGVGTVLKHFPGNTNVDPHTGLPEISLSADEIESQIIEPFTLLTDYHPSAILMSHARTQAHDEKIPACLSSYWVNQVVREQMKYDGLIISDDIFMAALANNGYTPEKAALAAINAGVDVIMLSTKLCASVIKILMEEAQRDESFAVKMHEAEIKVIQFKIKCGLLATVQRENDSNLVIENNDTAAAPASRIEQFNKSRNEGNALIQANFVGVPK